MKKFLLLALFFCFASIDCAAFQKYLTANLNLRTGPGTKYNVTMVIPRGTAVTIDEDCDCKWVPVEYDGKIGYISTKYLSNHPVNKQRRVSSTNYRTTVSKKYYINSYGERVQSPTYYSSSPPGATALCRDGLYSFSRSRRGTCSHHGGVARWL